MKTDAVLSMRNNYFNQKDLVLEISIILSKEIENNFTYQELRKADSICVFGSFNAVNAKMKKIIAEREEDFFLKTMALIPAHNKYLGLSISSSGVSQRPSEKKIFDNSTFPTVAKEIKV